MQLWACYSAIASWRTYRHYSRLFNNVAFAVSVSSLAASAQNGVSVTTFQNEPLAATPGYVRYGAPITVSARVLPADATGTITFSLDGVAIQTVPLTRQTVGDYVAFGDSITFAGYIGDPTLRYPAILGSSLNLQTSSYAANGITGCDVMPLEILPSNITNISGSNPLYSLLIGASDISFYGSGSHEALFNLCHQATLTWLGVPRPSKVLVGDAGASITSGSWTTNLVSYNPCCQNTWTTTTPGSSVRFQLQSTGNPIYLWYGIQTTADSNFTVVVDGLTSIAVPATEYPSFGNTASSYGYLRIPTVTGNHKVDVIAGNGPVAILGVGTAPRGGVPTVLASDIPNEQAIAGTAAAIVSYTADVLGNVALLRADGLDLRFVNTQNFMFATPAEMVDAKHPNALGLAELAQAFAVPITSAVPANDTVDAATASLTLPTLSIGPHRVDMAYSGDSKYPPENAPTLGYGVYDGSTSTTLTSDSSTYTTQTPVTLGANVSSNDLGEVDFFDTTSSGTTKLGTVWLNQPNSNPVPLVVPTLPAGQHTLSANYLGDYHWNGSTSTPVQVTVVATSTATTLSAPGSRFFAGAPIPLTAAVTPSSATGMVTFFDGTSQIGQAAISSGIASLTVATLAPGIHNLTASYAAIAVFSASQSPPLPIEIDQVTSFVSLTSSSAAATYGTPVTLTTTVTPAAATGTLSLLDSFVALGAGQPTAQTLAVLPQSYGTGSFTASALAPGTHGIVAEYSGDANDSSANSPPVLIQISRDASTTTLVGLPAATTYGMTVQLSASVSPAASTGTVTFTDSVAGPLAQVPISNGAASFSLSTLAPGAHTLSASYAGDSLRSPSASRALTTTIDPLTSTTTLTQPSATVYAGNPLTFSAAVSPSTAGGTVIFRDANLGVLGSAPVAKGLATLTLSDPSIASYAVTASYSGDNLDTASTSSAVSFQVVPDVTTTTLLSSTSSSAAAAPIGFTAAVTPASATGSVTFFDGATSLVTVQIANGTAATTVTTLAVGSHTLHAAYSGSTLDAASTSAPVSETITGDTTATTLALAQSSIVAGSTATANVRVTSAYTVPTGTITLRSGSTVLASGSLANAAAGSAYATLTFNSAVLGLGASPLVASYTGDGADQASDSSATTVTETVLPIPTALALALSASGIPIQGRATLTATVTASSIPSGSVTFLCNGAAIATVQLGAAGTASTIFSGSAIGSYAISATYSPTGFFASTPVAPPQTLTVSPSVSLTLTPNTLSSTRGSTTSVGLQIAPNFGFTGPIQAQCQTSATWIACTMTPPASVTSAISVPVQITIAQTTSAMVPLNRAAVGTALALLLPLLIPRRKRPRSILIAAMFAVTTLMTACGGSGYAFPTGPQSATITVTAAGTTSAAALTIDIVQ